MVFIHFFISLSHCVVAFVKLNTKVDATKRMLLNICVLFLCLFFWHWMPQLVVTTVLNLLFSLMDAYFLLCHTKFIWIFQWGCSNTSCLNGKFNLRTWHLCFVRDGKITSLIRRFTEILFHSTHYSMLFASPRNNSDVFGPLCRCGWDESTNNDGF